MKTREQFVNNIILNIEEMCHNENIVNYVKRLLKENIDECIEINDSYFRSKKYDEVVEINISNNSFSIYSTSWSTTTRKNISFFKDKDNILLTFSNNEIIDDGITSNNYEYEFNNNNLVRFSYSKKIDHEYQIGRETRIIKKDKTIDIYPIDNNDAIKIINENESINYFFTHINQISIEDIGLFSTIYSTMDSKVDYKNFQKCLR